MTRRRISGLFGALVALLGLAPTTYATDWIHWRGPGESGFSRELDLPATWDPATPGRENLIWKVPFGCRSTPLVMGGHVYFVTSFGDVPRTQTAAERLVTGERVVCLNAKTGEKIWEQKFNVFLTDIVTNRLGWANLTADPVGKKIYCHSSAGFLACMDGETGKVVWQHQLTEEYGRVTGYGGRVATPVCDSGLVIIGMVQASWGNYARGLHRFVAFEQETGKVAWWSEVAGDYKLATYYSNPIVANINGQRLMISGGVDGSLHAFQVRTGKLVWSYKYCATAVNPSPVIVGNYVLCSHGEENPDGGDIGRVICVDASKVKDGKPTLVWQYRDGTRFGLASPAADDKYLYVPDDAAKLYCFDIFKEPTGTQKINKFLWKFNYGTLSRGSPVIADNKVFISGVDARYAIIPLNGKKVPEGSHEIRFKAPVGGVGLVEVHCTTAIADGKVYFSTRDEFFCIGKNGADSVAKFGKIPEPAPETPAKEDDAIASIQVFPADVVLAAGGTTEFKVKAFNANGVELKNAKLDGVTWSLPAPPAPKVPGKEPAKEAPKEAPKGKEAPKTAGPPPLDGTIDEKGVLTLSKRPAQQGYVLAKLGDKTFMARVRVAPGLPYKQDFVQVPVGGIPGGWINTQAKYVVVEKDGVKVLSKTNTNPSPPVARAYAYITPPETTGYTIESDIMGVEQKDKLPDGGILANRYTFYLDGKTDEKGERTVRLISWEALPRIDVAAPFTWKSGQWYRLKLSVEVGEKEAVVKAKVWARGEAEPEKWTLEFTDPLPNREGAAALYGYVTNADKDAPGSEIYYANISITKNGAAKK
ncbi:PQQ-binding-like beta-propeller repeat protein [Zavarzinella formosa]|uniref:PQQ-binding-like beta-propeller repeat protein n=1 Tax=Zavarzinella formosa TaxID=360055 RepID=UPI0002EA3DBB|nr:PQQ-binding-like beta-propeller repeat protein [Zavarzinella formosa]